MKKIVSLIVLVGFGLIANAQLKIGDNPTTIDPNSVLELESTKRGVRFPRLGLTSTTSPAPLSAHVEGMTVYNTATVADVTPGFYFNDGKKWHKLLAVKDITNPIVADTLATLEPWHNVSTNKGAQKNTDSLYTMGIVGIKTNKPTATLDVKGTARIQNLGKTRLSDSIVTDSAGFLRHVSPDVYVSKKVDTIRATGIMNCTGADYTYETVLSGNTPITVTLPDPSACGLQNGQKIVVKSNSTATDTISKEYALGNAKGTWELNYGDVYEFVLSGGRWTLVTFPERIVGACNNPDMNYFPTGSYCDGCYNGVKGEFKPNPNSSPLYTVSVFDGCFVRYITLPPTGKNYGDQIRVLNEAQFPMFVSGNNTNTAALYPSLMTYVNSATGEKFMVVAVNSYFQFTWVGSYWQINF